MSSRNWSQLVDASWQKIESIFDVQTTTPPIRRSAPRTPAAPRKKFPPVSSRMFRRELKPRKLTYEEKNIEVRRPLAPEQQQRQHQTSDSGLVSWAATSTASMQPEDADKENQPECVDEIPTSIEAKSVVPGSLRDQLNKWMGSTQNHI